ncbi:MAG: cyclic nucleotide-binding domain-containing protein [Gammaproteobacteria bacterium]|nr:cyclic nucleotide-binding domain-containing protein [Gammaproteobacteria bacterium]MCB1924352.1 cyclic nucleotide-binding domain-containing protein [Gammaproteobacteria bacterium]
MANIHVILQDPRFVNAGIADRRCYQGGEAIIDKGSEQRGLYLIESGCVRVLERIELDDKRHIQPGICDLTAGDVFGELSLFTPGPRLASVVAVEPCELIEFDAIELGEYLDRHPQLGYELIKELFLILGCRLRQTDRRLGSLFAWGLKAHGIDQHL